MTMQSIMLRIEDRRCRNRRALRWRQRNRIASFRVLSVAKSLAGWNNLSTAAPVGWRLRWGKQSTEIVYWQESSKEKAPAPLGNGPEENRPI
jgi:hypothetical protein